MRRFVLSLALALALFGMLAISTAADFPSCC
jgi:hypothetical protein